MTTLLRKGAPASRVSEAMLNFKDIKPQENDDIARPWIVDLPPHLSGDGKRHRPTFKTKKEADTFIKNAEIAWDNHRGAEDAKLTLKECVLARSWFDEAPKHDGLTAEKAFALGIALHDAVCKHSGLTPEKAIDLAIETHVARGKGGMLLPWVKKYKALRTKQNRAHFSNVRRYSDLLVKMLGGNTNILDAERDYLGKILWSFYNDPDDEEAEPIEPPKIVVKNGYWRRWGAKTIKHIASVWHGIFELAVESGKLEKNPLSRIDLPPIEGQDIAIFSPALVEAILHCAWHNDPDLVPVLAIGFFLGLRMSELMEQDWSNISIPDKKLHVHHLIAKTGIARDLKLTDQLCLFLAPFREITPSGLIWKSGYSYFQKRRDALIERLEIPFWLYNACRRGFGSAHYALYDDLQSTLYMMGHTNAKMFLEHYRKFMTKEDAKRFFSIAPPGTVPAVGEASFHI